MSRDDVPPSAESVELAHDPSKDERGTVRIDPIDVVVVLFHDHGSRYVGKVYNDDWMKSQGWI
jgi:hypothetical protein